MFSGIIEQKAKIINISDGRFTLENIFGKDIEVGQSVSHDGACMTVESYDETSYIFFMMEESFLKTNFGNKIIGDFFNIERCLRVGDRIDGHFVSGHIDCTGTISFVEKKEDASLVLGVSFPDAFSKYTISKGSIAINGVSLTIVEVKTGYLSVSLIPLTQDWTNLGNMQLGDTVNLEFDMLAKYILNK